MLTQWLESGQCLLCNYKDVSPGPQQLHLGRVAQACNPEMGRQRQENLAGLRASQASQGRSPPSSPCYKQTNKQGGQV